MTNVTSKFITIIRPEFMSFCNDACRSASLNHLLFRIAYKCKDQPKEKIQAGEVLWYAKTELLVEEMSNAWGLCKVRGEVNALVKMNLIGRTGNPNWGVDRTKHFYFGEKQCAVFIKLCEENDICIVHLDLPPEVKHLIYSSNANDTSIKCTCEKQEANDISIECISYNHQMHSIDSSLAFDKSIGTITKNTTKIYNKDNDKEEGTYGDDANAHHPPTLASVIRQENAAYDALIVESTIEDITEQSPLGSYSQQDTTRNALVENGAHHVLLPDHDHAAPGMDTLHAAPDPRRVTQTQQPPLVEHNNNSHSHSQETHDNGLMDKSTAGSVGAGRSTGTQTGRRGAQAQADEPATSAATPRRAPHTAPARAGNAQDTSVQGVSRDARSQQTGQAQTTTGRAAADVVGEAQAEGVQLPAAPGTHQGSVQTTPSLSVENPVVVGGNSKAVGKGNKATPPSKKAKNASLEPVLPPSRPDTDAPFDVKKILAWGDYARQYAFPLSERSNSKSWKAREAARCIAGLNLQEDFFLTMYFNWMKGIRVDLGPLPDNALKSATWPDYSVDLWVFAEHAPEEIKKYREAKAKRDKAANSHSVSGRTNYTYQKGAGEQQEAPLPYKIVPQQSPRKLDLELKDDEQPRRRLRLHRVTPLAAAPAGM